MNTPEPHASPITVEQIAELRSLHAKSTPGPWGYADEVGGEIGTINGWVEPDEYRPIIHCSGGPEEWLTHSALIISMHAALPALLAEVERMRSFVQLVADCSNDPGLRGEAVKMGATP